MKIEQKDYQSPAVEMLELETEGTILQASGLEGSGKNEGMEGGWGE